MQAGVDDGDGQVVAPPGAGGYRRPQLGGVYPITAAPSKVGGVSRLWSSCSRQGSQYATVHREDARAERHGELGAEVVVVIGDLTIPTNAVDAMTVLSAFSAT